MVISYIFNTVTMISFLKMHTIHIRQWCFRFLIQIKTVNAYNCFVYPDDRSYQFCTPRVRCLRSTTPLRARSPHRVTVTLHPADGFQLRRAVSHVSILVHGDRVAATDRNDRNSDSVDQVCDGRQKNRRNNNKTIHEK